MEEVTIFFEEVLLPLQEVAPPFEKVTIPLREVPILFEENRGLLLEEPNRLQGVLLLLKGGGASPKSWLWRKLGNHVVNEGDGRQRLL